MERENNMKDFKAMEEDMPKFGAGSEYNRDQKEEARRKKFGIISKKYNPDAQPWILKVGGGKSGKKFKGSREGGVSENAAHFIFTQTKDGSIEAFPLNEWYNFQPIQRFKSLTAEEAEEEFGRRKKCVNMWSMKMRMKLKNKDDEEPEDPEDKPVKGAKGGDKKKLQISEMDEWMDSDDMSSSDESGGEEKKKREEDSDEEAAAKKAKGKQAQNQKKKKKNRDLDDEAFEVILNFILFKN
jgi:transcription initiation factor TFIIF subunit alpha